VQGQELLVAAAGKEGAINKCFFNENVLSTRMHFFMERFAIFYLRLIGIISETKKLVSCFQMQLGLVVYTFHTRWREWHSKQR
jgi:hypothetical protein